MTDRFLLIVTKDGKVVRQDMLSPANAMVSTLMELVSGYDVCLSPNVHHGVGQMEFQFDMRHKGTMQ